MDPARSDVVTQDEFALILARGLLIVSIGRLEPGAREEEIQVQTVVLVRLIVEAVEDRFVVPNVVERGKLGWIEVATGAHSIDRNEIAPLFASRAERDALGCRAERAVTGREAAKRLVDAQSAFRYRVD